MQVEDPISNPIQVVLKFEELINKRTARGHLRLHDS